MSLPEGVRSTELQAEAAERFVRVRAELGITSFGVNQIILEPGQRNRIHRHTLQEELYVVLAGTLTLVVEGESFEFPAGSAVALDAHVRRQLVNAARTPVSVLAIGGMAGHEHQGRDAEAFASWEDAEPGTPQTVPHPSDLPAAELA